MDGDSRYRRGPTFGESVNAIMQLQSMLYGSGCPKCNCGRWKVHVDDTDKRARDHMVVCQKCDYKDTLEWWVMWRSVMTGEK